MSLKERRRQSELNDECHACYSGFPQLCPDVQVLFSPTDHPVNWDDEEVTDRWKSSQEIADAKRRIEAQLQERGLSL